LINREEIVNTGNLELLANQVVEGFLVGLHKSPYHGFSVEFAEHRLYNPGESVRNMDWKLYARTDRLFVKKFEEETNLRCHILVDRSSSMYFPNEKHNKLKFSVLAAASLMQMLKRQRDGVGLSIFSDQIDYHTPIKSSASHHVHLLTELGRLLNKEVPQKKTNIADTLHEIADRIHKRSLIILFTDMLDQGESKELFEALQHLKYNKHELILFHTMSKSKELDFEFENRPYTFEDMESGEKIKLQPAEVKEMYRESILDFHKELKSKCNQYKIDFIETDVDRPVDQILVPFLVRRQKMRI
jgi:uncharacterized protein (DUF58 family)